MYLGFGETCCLDVLPFYSEDVAAGSSETSVPIYRSIRRRMLGDCRLNFHYRKSLKYFGVLDSSETPIIKCLPISPLIFSQCRFLLEKSIISQPVKIFLDSCGIHTIANSTPLFPVLRKFNFFPFQHSISVTDILALSSHLRLGLSDCLEFFLNYVWIDIKMAYHKVLMHGIQHVCIELTSLYETGFSVFSLFNKPTMFLAVYC